MTGAVAITASLTKRYPSRLSSLTSGKTDQYCTQIQIARQRIPVSQRLFDEQNDFTAIWVGFVSFQLVSRHEKGLGKTENYENRS